VRVLHGTILDVVVDLRRNKKTFGSVFQLEMSSENDYQLLVPKGFAHGFAVLSESVDLLYKTDEYHYPESEGGILFNDSTLKIDWRIPHSEMIVSDRDKKHPKLAEATFNF
jgi:dTDP-4-dehydrorhamnose 3,5-epimerase